VVIEVGKTNVIFNDTAPSRDDKFLEVKIVMNDAPIFCSNLRSCLDPDGGDKELGMFDKKDVRHCENYELYDSS